MSSVRNRTTLAAIVAAAAGSASLLTGSAFAGAPAGFVISELRTGQPGPDNSEYIEIRGTPGASLKGLSYIVIGDAASGRPPAQNGIIEAVVDLSGVTIPASGYLVIAESTFALGVANVTANLNFEDNDNVTHLLVTGFTGSVGSDVDADKDGVLDPVLPWSSILSSVALVVVPDPDGFSADFVYSANVVGPDGGNVPQHVYVCQNADNEYRIGAADPTIGDDTVGAANPICELTPAPVLINEIRIDQTGTDNDEYFELSGPAGASLAGYTYVVIGDGTGGSGTIEAVVDLSALNIPADGYLLVTEPSFTLQGATPDFVTAANGLNFENNDNVTHLLVKDFTGTNGQDLDTNNDGVLDVTPWSSIADSIAVLIGTPGVGGNEFVYSGNTIGPDGGFAPSAIFRCFPTGSWTLNTFDPSIGVDTPGYENFNCPSCGGVGSCFEEHASSGCDVIDCCSLVCAIDPSCCTNGWDAACVSTALAQCNAGGAAPALSINELRIAQSGADNDEYVEIVGAPGTSLNGVAYVVIGDGLDSNGVIENVTLLSGTIPSDGYFVVAKSTFTIGNPDLIRDSLNFEDGDTVTHLLVFNFQGSLGTDLDVNNDCTLDSTPWASTIDGIVLSASDLNCGYAATVVGPDGPFSPSHVYKCTPDGTWTIGLFDSLVNDTPGAANIACPPVNPCGLKGAQDCFTEAATPGCADADCCNSICVADPSCCSNAWDAECVAAANVLCFVPPTAPAVRLSEIRIDQLGTDNDEYFEIYGDAGTSLNGLTYVVIGDGAASQGSGVVEMALPLNGFMIPADEFLLAAKSTFTLAGAVPDYVIPTGLFFENSDQVTHLLVWQFTGAIGTDLDTDDDGILDSTPWTSIVDSVALIGPAGGELVYSTTTVGPDGNFVPSQIRFCPSTSTWTLGTFDPTLSTTESPGLPNPECTYSEPCTGDLDGNGLVDAADLAALLGSWGGSGPADFDNSGTVDAGDLATLLGAWGACP